MDFLAGRSQAQWLFTTDSKCTYSKPRNVLSRFPQGTASGPTLLLLYINHMITEISNHLILYADDSKLFGVPDESSIQSQKSSLPSERQTRAHSKKLHKPRVNSRIRQDFFSQRVINDWNCLSKETESSTSAELKFLKGDSEKNRKPNLQDTTGTAHRLCLVNSEYYICI